MLFSCFELFSMRDLPSWETPTKGTFISGNYCTGLLTREDPLNVE